MEQHETRLELVIPSPGQLFTPAVIAILLLMIGGFAIICHAEEFTAKYLALSVPGLLSGKIWQLVTYSIVEPNALILIFECFILVFVGSNIEKEYRASGLVLLWLVVSVSCGLVWVLACWLTGRNYIGVGPWGCGFGLSAAFGVLFFRRRYIAWFWVMEAQYVSWGLIAIGAIFCIPRLINLLWLSGAAAGYLYVKLKRAYMMRMPSLGRKRPQGFVDID
jgi:membrane associated rhomboid family serine protease